MPQLDEIRTELIHLLVSAPDGRLNLAQVGAKLRTRFPDFNISNIGYPNLKSLLLAMPEIGRIEETEIGTWELVRVAPRLTASWWNAVTEYDAHKRAWLDLARQQLVSDLAAVEAEPERFLELPRADLQRQRVIASQWASSLAPAQGETLLAALNDHPGMESFLEALREQGLTGDWGQHRAATIAREVLAWASEHGVDKSLLLDQTPRPRSSVRPREQAVPFEHQSQADSHRMSEVELRLFLHGALDQMSYQELQQLWLPVRLLAR